MGREGREEEDRKKKKDRKNNNRTSVHNYVQVKKKPKITEYRRYARKTGTTGKARLSLNSN
jgi:DNA transposition AAA+ family ATPase